MDNLKAYEKYLASIEQEIQRSVARMNAALGQSETSGSATTDGSWEADFNDCLQSVLQSRDAANSLARPPKNARLLWCPDYALPMFEYARLLHSNPADLAIDVSLVLRKLSVFSRVEATGPYVNMRFADATLMKGLERIVSSGQHYGRVADNTGKVAIVEYSSPNVAKPFGINHLRSTVIGESLARFLDATGYVVVRDNHIGDWGTQFGNLLAACQEYAAERDFASFSTDEMTELYVRFSQEKKLSPRLVRLGQECFAKLEAGDPGLREKWAIALSLSMKEFAVMYERLSVKFDTQIGEGYYVEAAKNLVGELVDECALPGLIEYDAYTKAAYINAEHPVVLRTQDGYCVYAARDLAAIQFRERTYRPDVVLYVVGEEQSSYFRSILEVAQKAGLSRRSDGLQTHLEHIGFGLLLDKEGKKLSTRKGTSGKLETVIDALYARAAEETKARNPGMSADLVHETACKIANGALIWNDLRTDRLSSVRFDIDRMLELGGGSVIDVLYTYSRTCSILDKLSVTDDSSLVNDFPDVFSTDVEHQLSFRLGEFCDVVRKTAEMRAPHIFVAYLQELSQIHGRFYEESRVTGIDDRKVANLRIALHRAYKIVIQNGLELLNIPVSGRI